MLGVRYSYDITEVICFGKRLLTEKRSWGMLGYDVGFWCGTDLEERRDAGLLRLDEMDRDVELDSDWKTVSRLDSLHRLPVRNWGRSAY
jgi:hypothetical protein